MGTEIERKWAVESSAAKIILAKAARRPLWPEVAEIEQGYLAISGDREVRIRRTKRLDPLPGTHYHLTEKSGSGLSRQEEERVIGEIEFDELWPQTQGRRIEKIRRTFELRRAGSIETLRVEVDEFVGRHVGLWLIEIEFASEVQAHQFDPEGPFGPVVEVTLDNRYKNRWLAMHGVP